MVSEVRKQKDETMLQHGSDPLFYTLTHLLLRCWNLGKKMPVLLSVVSLICTIVLWSSSVVRITCPLTPLPPPIPTLPRPQPPHFQLFFVRPPPPHSSCLPTLLLPRIFVFWCLCLSAYRVTALFSLHQVFLLVLLCALLVFVFSR